MINVLRGRSLHWECGKQSQHWDLLRWRPVLTIFKISEILITLLEGCTLGFFVSIVNGKHTHRWETAGVGPLTSGLMDSSDFSVAEIYPWMLRLFYELSLRTPFPDPSLVQATHSNLSVSGPPTQHNCFLGTSVTLELSQVKVRLHDLCFFHS